MSSVIAPVNPMAAEGKDVVMDVMRRDRKKFFDLVEAPKNWKVQTRCREWEGGVVGGPGSRAWGVGGCAGEAGVAGHGGVGG